MDESLNSPCAELRQLVTEYLEEVMTGEELTWFESHVHECGSCEVHVHEVKAFVGVLARCRPEPVSPETRQRLHAAFREWRAEVDQ